MVLLNAVFFAGNWTYQFDSYGTRDSPFTTLERDVKDVPTMHLTAPLVAGEINGLDAKFVRLPFNVSKAHVKSHGKVNFGSTDIIKVGIRRE